MSGLNGHARKVTKGGGWENKFPPFAQRICGCDETLGDEVEAVHLWKGMGAKSKNSLLGASLWGFGIMSLHLPMQNAQDGDLSLPGYEN
jgi:hypothetical protein